MYLSLIIPVCNEEQNIAPLYTQLRNHCGNDAEIIFVDDGSTDNSLPAIQTLALADPLVKCISFSRNFGHQNALLAGIEHAAGEFLITMDGDLQHPPEMLPGIIQKLEEGFDVVNTKRLSTDEAGFVKTKGSKTFYRFINFLSNTHIEPGVADFKGFSRKVQQSILLFTERDVFLRGMFSWVGFSQITIPYKAPARQFGSTKYSLRRMLSFALKGTLSFSFKPLRLAIVAGLIVSAAAFGFAVFALVAYFKGETVAGWASTIIALMLLGGTQLLAIGLLGEYIAGLFIEAKRRPRYLVNKKINLP